MSPVFASVLAPRSWLAALAQGAVLAALPILASCGGAASGAGPTAAGGTSAAEGHEGGNDGARGAEGPSGPTLPSCDDGTCFRCGEGICPKGFFCDEKAAGGAACSWLPECAEAPSCGCVTKVIGDSCACAEKSGGVFCE